MARWSSRVCTCTGNRGVSFHQERRVGACTDVASSLYQEKQQSGQPTKDPHRTVSPPGNVRLFQTAELGHGDRSSHFPHGYVRSFCTSPTPFDPQPLESQLRVHLPRLRRRMDLSAGEGAALWQTLPVGVILPIVRPSKPVACRFSACLLRGKRGQAPSRGHFPVHPEFGDLASDAREVRVSLLCCPVGRIAERCRVLPETREQRRGTRTSVGGASTRIPDEPIFRGFDIDRSSEPVPPFSTPRLYFE